MTWPRLTIRSRITLLCTGLFVICGAILVVITYTLVATLLPTVDSASIPPKQAAYLADCGRDLQRTDVDPERRSRCLSAVKELTDPALEAGTDPAFQVGVNLGAQRQRDQTLTHLLVYSLATLAAVAALAALGGWMIARRVLRPVHQLTRAAQEASEHNLSARVSLDGPLDELREMADTFNGMLGRLHTAFESQRRFIANASHELRSPMTDMRTTVDVVLSKPAPTLDELVGMGRDIRTAVDQADTIMDALLTLTRNEYGLTVREPVDLAAVAEEVLDSVELAGLRRHTSLRPATTAGDPVLLERLIINLVDNAVRYNVPGGTIRLTTSTMDGRAVLTVANTGSLIAPEAVDGLMEPFRRLHDRSGNDGFGLGLAIVASISAVHGGTTTAQPLPEGGLHVRVDLPVAGPESGSTVARDAGRDSMALTGLPRGSAPPRAHSEEQAE
jgi:signal transduction histidine kinase